MKYVSGPGRPERGADVGMTGKGAVVSIRGTNPAADVFVQQWQFYIQYGSLDRIQPAVAAHQFVVISFSLSVVGNHPEFFRQRFVHREKRSGISVGSQVF